MKITSIYKCKAIKLAAYFVRLFLVIILSNLISNFALATGDDYLVGPGDMVKISVFDYPDLAIETRVSASGRITFPLLGEVAIGGKSPAESEIVIANELMQQGYIRDPHVTLVVNQFVSQQVSILGYVIKPGNYVLEKPISLLELLALAGGVSPDGDDKALLTRNESGKSKSIEIDLYDLFHGDLKKDVRIKPGDIVYVTKSQVFYIYGEVQKPGMYKLQRTMNVAQAISAGGGLTPKGTDSSVEIKRKQAQDKFLTETAELGELVHPDDVVYVRESWF
jgi:polysaccharide biosynthesis/export protein